MDLQTYQDLKVLAYRYYSDKKNKNALQKLDNRVRAMTI